MNQMLVVDDEQFAVEGIVHGRDWSLLGIGKVFTANGADEARKILTRERIDILICDIEMPDEDGLSLVGWVREHSPHTESLFLTCHTEFAYAKKAVSLGSFDYLLKPVDGEELSAAVTGMLQAIREKEEQQSYNEMYRKYRSLWQKEQPRRIERFWQDLLSRRILGFGDFLERELAEAGVGLGQDSRVLPVLISAQEWGKPLESRDQEIMDYAVKKAAEEVWLEGRRGEVVTDKSGVLFVLLYGESPAEGGEAAPPASCSVRELTEAGNRFYEACQDYFYCSVTCYIGGFRTLQALPGLCESLRAMERDTITRTPPVLLHVPRPQKTAAAGLPEEIHLSGLVAPMLNGERETVTRYIHDLVERMEERASLHGQHLESLHQDTLQIIYHFLQVKGISASDVPGFSAWASARVRGLRQYMHWAEGLAAAVMETAFEPEETDGVIQRSIRYIQQNVEEEISRESIADHVGLNPAYLSRLFKKETGQNLIDFLITAKMNRARDLLDTTVMTVSAVAQQVGYSNFSHFTKMFRKQFEVNPQEYRKVTKRMD
ncbi:AraC family transcriptional regulator [Paenibacillus stellifer]|uniref:AraC family transcriptional regulator n=1 Tax=Paenibacillus stellifer TaxID=169760 RepID=A0A089N938_9BACL|nr:helix-turn-helix domain-containing protein [Paenibacillus stellifer]AIQ65319.1 AraC family transcriptional regulator [Paenibacillus stellifer]